MSKKKVMVVFGTRPEAIKMCPLVKEMRSRPDEFDVMVCVTGQHKEMLYQVLDAFDITPDHDLHVMRYGQTLFEITSDVLIGMGKIIDEHNPDVVLVHGDTTTAFATSLAAFYWQVPIGHVEAGLRTYDIYSPYPEEFNRQAIDIVADWYFAPTADARKNLLSEGKNGNRIYVTGNTGIDALFTTVRDDFHNEHLEWAKDSRLVLLTAHRRENLGASMHSMFRAIKRVLDEHDDVKIIYPIHMNPRVRDAAHEELDGNDRLRIIEPLDVVSFHNFLSRSNIVLTDSGGIQEEAPALGKPVLVMRDTTERPEGVAAGTLKLVGTDEKRIYREFSKLLTDDRAYDAMSHAVNPYGDGFSSKRIADIIVGKTPEPFTPHLRA